MMTADAGAVAGQFMGTGSCAPQDGGVGGTCVPNCNEGFQCQGGVCVLNGGGGPVQITLRWNTHEDLDLHVLEPLPNGGTCEIYYGDTNRPGDPSSCGAVGWLDLDSEPGCFYDYVDTENIIYSPANPAPCGTYTVWVNHYENCNASLAVVPFELEVRFAGMNVGICGAFQPTDLDWDDGNGSQSRFMMTFTVP
jgi:hypothetical protein